MKAPVQYPREAAMTRMIPRIIATVTAVLMIISFAMASQVFAADSFSEISPTKNLSVIKDDGNGSAFRQLPINYVQFKDLDLNEAVITSGADSYSIVMGKCTGQDGEYNHPHLLWTGKVKFGGKRHTTTKAAVTVENKLPSVTVRFPGGAELSDGNTADVEMTLSDISVNLTESLNSKITDSTTVKIALLRSGAGHPGEKKALRMSTTAPKTSYADYDHNSMACVGQRYKVTVRIVDPSTGNVIDKNRYPSMLIVFKDLDVPDQTLATHSNDKTYWPQRYNGKYAEGVEMVSGWGTPVVMAHEGGNAFSRPLVNAAYKSDNLWIKGDGDRYAAFGGQNDSGTYYSGFAAPVSPQGFSFYWTGTVPGGKTECMATQICAQPTVAVWAKRGEGGSLTNSGLNEWSKNTHLMNSAGVYSFRPDKGYAVRSLKVDGVDIELTEQEKKQGGEYIFQNLNKNPIVERVEKDGNILDAAESGHYEIEVLFERAAESSLRITKNVKGSLGDTSKEFEFSVELTGMPSGFSGTVANSGAVLVSGFSGSAYTADKTGKVSLSLRMKDDTSIELKGLPVGATFRIAESRSDHYPSYTVKEGNSVIDESSVNDNKDIETKPVTVSEGDTVYTADFVNSRDIAVNTGIAADTGIPYGAAAGTIAAAAAAAAAGAVRRRRRL